MKYSCAVAPKAECREALHGTRKQELAEGSLLIMPQSVQKET